MGKRIEIKHKLGGAKVCEAEEDFKDPTIQKEDFWLVCRTSCTICSLDYRNTCCSAEENILSKVTLKDDFLILTILSPVS